MEDFKQMFKEKNNDYKTMPLMGIMDLYSRFHYVAYKAPNWSVVYWDCTCVACLRDCVCLHSTLIGMFFRL
jgi:hypothetical protein